MSLDEMTARFVREIRIIEKSEQLQSRAVIRLKSKCLKTSVLRFVVIVEVEVTDGFWDFSAAVAARDVVQSAGANQRKPIRDARRRVAVDSNRA